MDKIRKWLHDKLGWGYPDKFVDGDHFQSNYSCRFCDHAITKDSTGAWFHLSSKINKQ